MSSPCEELSSAFPGTFIFLSKLCVTQNCSQQSLVDWLCLGAAEKKCLGNNDCERVHGEPDVDHLRTTASAPNLIASKRGIDGRLIEHCLGRIFSNATAAERTAAIDDVLTAKPAQLDRCQTDKILDQERQNIVIIEVFAGGARRRRRSSSRRRRI